MSGAAATGAVDDAGTTVRVEFLAPISGLPERTAFDLVPLDGEGVLFSLRSADDADLRLVLVTPERFFPDYSPVIDAATAGELELTGAQDAVLLVVVNPGGGLAEATANLLAPVVLNHRTRRAAQVVLAADLPLRAPLLPA